MKKTIPYISVAIVTVLMLITPKNSLENAHRSLMLCFDVIIPSLFPFFICSGLLIYSGMAKSISKFCRPIMKPLFNINSCGASAFVLGIISGYPLGAVTACNLYESGYLSKTETERLLSFCNNSGPLFILGAVGTAIYSNPKIGILLYIAHIFAALSVGFIFRFYASDKHSAPDYTINQSEQGFAETFSQVLNSSINSILTVCGAIIFFGAVSGTISGFLPKNGIAKALITAVLEMTNGINSISLLDISLTNKLLLSAFAVGFAGLCIHLQVMATVAKQHLSLLPYIFGKLLHGIIASIYTLILLKIFPQTLNVFSQSNAGGYFASSLYSIISTLFCILLTVFVIIFSFMAGKKYIHPRDSKAQY